MAKRDDTTFFTDPGGPGIPPTQVRRNPVDPTTLGADPRVPPPPYIDARVTDAAALRYAQGAQERRKPLAPPKYTTPVAGGPDMPIPLLNGEAAEGATMAAQALWQRGSMAMPTPPLDGMVRTFGEEPALRPGIVEGAAHQQPVVTPAPNSGGLHAPTGILPTDLLPEAATKDPAFRSGHGAMFAVNQQELARKYGVVRNKELVPPQLLTGTPGRPGTGKLRAETVAGLEALHRLEETAPSDGQARAEVDPDEPPMSDEEKQRILGSMDDYDISRVKKAMFKDMLNNDVQREIIEKRLKPLDIGELIVSGRVTQVVPIRPGVFEPEYQSYQGDEDLILKRLVGEEEGSDRYIMDKYALMGFTVALRALNKRPLPDYLDAEGHFDNNLFWKKYSIVSRLNYHMLSSMMVNWFWFDLRVRKLFRAEELGNG